MLMKISRFGGEKRQITRSKLEEKRQTTGNKLQKMVKSR